MVQDLIERARKVRTQILEHYNDADIQKKHLVLTLLAQAEKDMGIEFFLDAPANVHIMGIEMCIDRLKKEGLE